MPIAYLSAQFSDTQCKWNTVAKEGYAINLLLDAEMAILPRRCRNTL